MRPCPLPKRTSNVRDCCHAKWPLNPISPVANPCCNRVLFGVVPALVKAMRRRDFIKGISVWTALPRAARAQSRERKRRVAVLMGGLLSGDLDGQAEAAALEAGLTELGWKLGGNIELEYRWPGAELDQVSIAANEIVAMRPDLVVSRSTPTTAIMMNRGLPIVFVLVTDPL